MSTLKAFGVVAVMIACFVVIYPRFMHPFVLRGLGLNEAPTKESDNTMYPPHYRAMHPGSPKPQTTSDDARKQHARQSPPHPGMRAAADMQRQQSQQGSGRGMMGVVLPMYAIGIVLYLIYTLFKVFNKSKGTSWNEEMQYNRLDRDYPLDNMGLPVDYETSGDVRSFFTNDQQRKELEHLLTRVDDKNVSLDEMRLLQKRLEETEAQMSKILKTMQSVQKNVKITEVAQDSGVSEVKSKDLIPDKENDTVLGTVEGMVEKMDKQKDVESEHNGKAVSETDGSSNNDSEKLESKLRKLNQEVDFDGIDKDIDVMADNVIDDREVEENADEKINEINEDADPTKPSESNLRHRKGRCDSEQ